MWRGNTAGEPMPVDKTDTGKFDLKLAKACASAFSASTDLGCTVSDTAGNVLHESGFGCGSCALCHAAGRAKDHCARAQAYGMAEAARFGGKYIYFCPMGLTCFVSPIMGQKGGEANITAGPLLMVEREDYISFDLRDKLRLPPGLLERACDALKDVPYIPPEKVHSLSVLLFMAVGFMHTVSTANRMLETQDVNDIQGQISAYILELKRGETPPVYPLDTERRLLSSIVDSDRNLAQELLNELLGHILFSSGGDVGQIKFRMYELLALMSRAAVDAGASPGQALDMNAAFFAKAQPAENIDHLCFLVTDVMNRFIDIVFRFSEIKHMDVIHKAVQFMKTHYAGKITLEDVAREVYLSPSYFSKVFKAEMGCNFNTYLNRLRIENSKKLLLQNIKLVDIASLAGFEDQSYFTKVFKKVTGTSPNRYRELGGRL
jgi:AraC-like DNA-binding protein/ligand-binding sensor protein